MSYMQAEMTGRQRWLRIDGGDGITFVPADEVGHPGVPRSLRYHFGDDWPDDSDLTEERFARVFGIDTGYSRSADTRGAILWRRWYAAVRDVYDGRAAEITSVGFTYGYGVRSSAAGYLDCTPWAVYDSRSEALDAVQSEREENGEEPEEEPEEDDEPPEFVPGTHALTTSPDELALCAQVAADGPRSVALAMLADWRTERDLPAPGSAVEFFAWQSVCGLLGSADRLAHACDLADSEQWGRRLVAEGDLAIGWESDPMADWDYGDGPNEACIIYRRNPRHDELTEGDSGFRVHPNAPEWVACESLHGIDRPSDDYRRLVEAELFGQLRAEFRANPPARELIALIPADESE